MTIADQAPAQPWTLRPYQLDALRSIRDAWNERREALLVLATGLGKTTVFAEVLRRRRDAGRGRALVLAHRIELLEQAAERIRLAGLSCDLESGEMRAPKMALAGQSEVVIATVQSMRGKRLQSWHPQTFTTIVIDEAHHSTAAGYRAVIDYFADAKVLGVTATPDRGDEVALGHIYGPEPVFTYGIVEGINGGYLSRIRSLSIDMPSLDMSSVRVTKQEHGRDLNADDLSRQMKAERALHEIARPFADHYGGRQSIIFTPSVEVAHALSSVLTPYIGPGLVSSLDGSSPKDERKRVLDAFKRNEIRVLVNCALFTEGFDAPATSCVAVARPTKSRALYAQMVGRGTRIHPGKEDLLVLNFEPKNERHTLVSPIDLMAGEDLPEAVVAAAKASGDADSLRALSNAKEAAQKRMEAQERDRQRAKLVADAKYRVRQLDPFAELGIDGELGRDRGPRATDRQREALESIGFKLGGVVPSRREAAGLLDEVTKRRTKGLCTIKQMRQLARFGLRTDLTFAEAGQAMTALADAGWKVTPGIADRFGAE